MKDKEKRNIKTSDLYFAAYLQCVGCKIVNTERDGNKNIFTFEDDKNRDNLKELYFNEDDLSKVPALKYANNIRSIKTFCYVKNGY